MWISYPAIFLVIIAIIGAIVGGGIFTIVLIPVAVIAVIAAVATSMAGRAAGVDQSRQQSQSPDTGGNALPRRRPADTGRTPTTPDALTDARQRAQ